MFPRYIVPLLFAGIVSIVDFPNSAVAKSSSNITSTSIIVFQSEEKLQRALQPLSFEEVTRRIEKTPLAPQLELRCDDNLEEKTPLPLRNKGPGNQVKIELYRTETVTVYYPETPRVPHHLTIALNRKNTKGISDISPEENSELFATIKKITEIYKILNISGFVIAQFDIPQQGHLNRYVVEIIPHMPGFNNIKNILDKIACSIYVFCRTENFSPITHNKIENIDQHVTFWKEAFQQEHAPLNKTDTMISFPHQRKEAYNCQAEQVLHQLVVEWLENMGGVMEDHSPIELLIPAEIPNEIHFVPVTRCVFCDETIIDRQLVYEYENVCVLYNIRKGAKPGLNFLILPRRHTEKVYNLNPEEINSISVMRKALVEVLKNTHPECEVVGYIQDAPSVGQTVFHSHEQVVAFDPATIAWTSAFDALYPNSYVSEEEMRRVCQEFGEKLHQKLSPNEEKIAL